MRAITIIIIILLHSEISLQIKITHECIHTVYIELTHYVHVSTDTLRTLRWYMDKHIHTSKNSRYFEWHVVTKKVEFWNWWKLLPWNRTPPRVSFRILCKGGQMKVCRTILLHSEISLQIKITHEWQGFFQGGRGGAFAPPWIWQLRPLPEVDLSPVVHAWCWEN